MLHPCTTHLPKYLAQLEHISAEAVLLFVYAVLYTVIKFIIITGLTFCFLGSGMDQ